MEYGIWVRLFVPVRSFIAQLVFQNRFRLCTHSLSLGTYRTLEEQSPKAVPRVKRAISMPIIPPTLESHVSIGSGHGTISGMQFNSILFDFIWLLRNFYRFFPRSLTFFKSSTGAIIKTIDQRWSRFEFESIPTGQVGAIV